ncbi:MAG: hypothetical protein COA44_15225 [Arcobacter sp.]|nr:MAG: hypothetical protein COA44_15225 [Arcobacter sp.]
MIMYIYLDESGDLGWKFNAPYRRGGSSRYITISTLTVPHTKRHLPKRIIKKLYDKYKWNPKKEIKWSDMKLDHREEFARRAVDLFNAHDDIQYHAITVKKERVQAHIRNDENKLYNYMIKLLLLDEMAKHDEIIFVPDPRSIKVESGNSLHDYLQTCLWFEKSVSTKLSTKPQDSASNRNIQFADMLSGIVQGNYEDNKRSTWNILNGSLISKRLYF